MERLTAGRVRVALTVVVAVVVIGWLVRSPTTQVDVESGTDAGPPSGATDLAEPVLVSPIPTTDTADRLNVAVLDPVTLELLTPTLTTVAPDFTASAGQELVLAESFGGGSGALVRAVGDLDSAEDWLLDRIDPLDTVAWVGRSGGTLAWITNDGQVKARLAQTQGLVGGEELPPATRLLDARLLDEEQLAVVTTSREGNAPAILTLFNLSSHVVAYQTEMTVADGTADHEPALAWDLPSGRLYAGQSQAWQLQSFDLADGGLTSVSLPEPSHRAQGMPQQTQMHVMAVDGRVTVSGVDDYRLPGGSGDTFRAALGVSLFDGDLGSVDAGPIADLPVTRAFPVPGSDRVVLLTDHSGIYLSDGAELRLFVLRSQLVQQVLPGEEIFYLVTCPAAEDGCDPYFRQGERPGRRLVALNPQTSGITGQLLNFPEADTFLPSRGLLVTPEMP